MLKQLKEDTRPWHDRVEEVLGSNKLMSDTYQEEDYIRLLGRLHHAFNQLEPAIYQRLKSTKAASKLNLEHRLHKRSLLQQDLTAFHQHVSSNNTELTLGGTPEAWGAFYVLEGSSLGGAAIYRHLRKLGWPPEVLGFYGYYGADTGPLWKEFKAVFEESNGPTEVRYKRVLQGAEQAYAVFAGSAE